MLGISLAALVLPEPTPGTSVAEDDTARLGALLHATETLTPINAICEVLGWTLEHTRAALDDLDRHLRPAGLRVHEVKGEVRIVRRVEATDAGKLKELLRRHQARRGLGLSEARVLADLAAGRLDTKKLSNPNQVALARLRNAGLVDLDDEPHPQRGRGLRAHGERGLMSEGW